jgi:drug/metabolite transporter (DMT)-like permease
VLFGAMCVLWGIPYLMIKVAVIEVSAPVLVLARTAVGAAVLLPLAIRAGGFDVVRLHWPWVLAFAVLEIIGPWWLIADAERRLSSSMAGLLIASVPIISAVLARFFGDTERLGRTRLIGLLVGFGGVVLLAAPQLGGGTALSVGEMLVVAVGYATAPLIAGHRMADVPDVPLTATCLALAAIVYAAPAAATWPTSTPSTRVLLALAGLALLCTALAFVVFFALIREVGATRAMVFTYVNPAVAVTAGVVLLGEPLTPSMITAFVLILAGSVLATSRARGTVAAGAAPPCAA